MKYRRLLAVPAIVAASIVLLSLSSITAPTARATESTGQGRSSTLGVGAMAWTPTLRPFDGNREKVRRNLSTEQRNAILHNCWLGYLCVAAGQGDGKHTVYELYYCSERSLTNFLGSGAVTNNQHGRVFALLKDRSGIPIKEIPSDNVPRRVDWNPIYFIGVC